MEKIPTVIVEFRDMPNLWLSEEEWKINGGYKGVLKSMCLSIGWIKEVHHVLKPVSDYPTSAWEG